MGAGKPIAPANLMGTLTSSDHIFAHTSSFTKFRDTCCALATLDYLERFEPKDYVRIVAFSPDLPRAFFYGETISIDYSTPVKSLSLAIHMKASKSSLKVLLQ